MGKRTAGTTRQEQIKSGQIQEQKIRPAIGSTEGTPKEAAGLQTFQIGNKVVSKADFESFINSEKVTLAAQGTPDLTPGAQPFDKPREAGVQPTAGRTAEQFQQTQQREQTISEALSPEINIPSQKQRFPGQFTTTPVVGQAQSLAQAERDQRLINKIRKGEATNQEIQQATGRLNLTEIDMEVIKAGDAHIDFFNSKIDSLQSFLPREARRFVPLFSAPSKEVEENLALLTKTKDNLFLNYQSIQNGVAVEENLRQIRENEQTILRYESIIKLMTIQSGALQSNPEQIQDIQVEVNNILKEISLKRAEYIRLGINI